MGSLIFNRGNHDQNSPSSPILISLLMSLACITMSRSVLSYASILTSTSSVHENDDGGGDEHVMDMHSNSVGTPSRYHDLIVNVTQDKGMINPHGESMTAHGVEGTTMDDGVGGGDDGVNEVDGDDNDWSTEALSNGLSLSERRVALASSSDNVSTSSRDSSNVSSEGRPGTRREKKSFVARIYEALFLATHARLHPPHLRPTRVIVVDQRGLGQSRTVQGAIDMVKLDNKWRIEIIVRPGVYREKVHIPIRKPFITFQGSGSGNTVITWNARASDRGQSGGILGTYDSASVAIDSDYFVAKDITFQNTAPKPPPGAQGMQAVALRISGDKAAFVDCRILGAQDTLFDHMGRHFFLRCYIEGAIDFIFGDGRSLYLSCELHANAVSYGAIAASQRNGIGENTGFSFVQCRITGTGLLYLGRAWGQYARIIFAFCYFDDIIIPDAWYDWGDTSRRETVFFGEYMCWGPGAQPRWRVSWSRQLSYAEARPFLGIGFINGHKWFNILT